MQGEAVGLSLRRSARGKFRGDSGKNSVIAENAGFIRPLRTKNGRNFRSRQHLGNKSAAIMQFKDMTAERLVELQSLIDSHKIVEARVKAGTFLHLNAPKLPGY
jgi:hypothetical protein